MEQFPLKAVKLLASNKMKSPGRALETDAKLGNAAVLINSKANLSTIPDLIKFNHTGKGLEFVILIIV